MRCCVIGLVDISPEFGDICPLDEARIRALTVNRYALLDLIDSSDAFITELASPAVGCITWPQRDHLINIIQPRDRNEKLLKFLTRRSFASFKKFVEVLSREKAHLMPLLVTDGGETVLMCNRNCKHCTVHTPPYYGCSCSSCLQCFDAVGCAAGRASGL